MITKIAAYKSSDGTAHASLEEAQRHELASLFADIDRLQFSDIGKSAAVDALMKQQDKVVDILTMKPNSLPKARAINGGRKSRKPKHVAAQTTMFTEPPAAPAA